MGSETSSIHLGKKGSLCSTALDLFPKSLGSIREEVAWSPTWSLGQKMLGPLCQPRQSSGRTGWQLFGGTEPDQTLQGLSTRPLAFSPCLSFSAERGESDMGSPNQTGSWADSKNPQLPASAPLP